jgi:hypothetical protein
LLVARAGAEELQASETGGMQCGEGEGGEQGFMKGMVPGELGGHVDQHDVLELLKAAVF